MKRIAPPRLLGRDAELAELAGFCLEIDRGPYVWWRAGPWAGKSALLSTFVLHPHEQLAGRVWIVSFFVTARLAAQDTREAFTTVLLEQLCALTGQDLSASVDEATREAYLLDLLGQGAAACQAAGGRLVLILDGLDEDRGVTVGPEAHSIAGLLPAHSPAGMRIIVAGRPNPPIPDDVPDWHPLRDPGIIRLLADSPHARDLQRLSQTELKCLLKGSRIEQDLLGLLTAARGGLSGADLHELTGAELVHIEDVLHTVAGRTFTRRVATWAPGTGPEVYLLGHEELHTAACRYLGNARIAAYQQRLHAWADTYRTPPDGRQPWPAGTPEYLLRGYSRMLESNGEIARLVALATDSGRHDRMLDLSGGDAAALAEITTAQTLLLANSEPDLLGLARLSIHRGRLESRNENIPANLPAVWILLGQSGRAEALARGITDPYRQALALAELARSVATNGELDRAEQLAHTITDLTQRARALAEVARAATIAEELGRAQRLVTDAEQQARSIPSPQHQVWALAEVATAGAIAGALDRARRLATDAEQLACGITDPEQQEDALAEVARAVAAVGELDRADQLARRITDPYRQARALAHLTRAVAAVRDLDRAEQLAHGITDRYRQAWALAQVAWAAATASEFERGQQLVAEAEELTHGIAESDQRSWALAEVIVAVAAIGDLDRAEQLTHGITDPHRQLWTSVEVARAAAAAGKADQARRLATDAEQLARNLTTAYRRPRVLAEAALVAAIVGETDRAGRLAHDAEHFAYSITDTYRREWVLAAVARAVAPAGELDQAEQLARSITEPSLQASALAELIQTMAATGKLDRAEQLAHGITEPYFRASALADVAAAVAVAGDLARAEQLAYGITHSEHQLRALTEVARTMAANGELEPARRLATKAEQLVRTINYINYRQQVLPGVEDEDETGVDSERVWV